jgi:outer membrane protein, multidrug efflux system
MRLRCATMVCAALSMSGCVVGPDYRRPALDMPAQHRNAGPDATAASIADTPWWTLFGDPLLVRVVEETLQSNLDLRIAAAQILEAQAQIVLARAPLYPQVSAQLQATRTNNNAARETASSFLGALNVSWAIDFWGRYARAAEAARALLLATEEGRRAVIASLISSAGQTYLQLTGLRQRLDIVRRTADTQRDSLRLVTLLARQGVQSAAEVRQAEGQLLSTESQIPSLERQIAQTEDALALLTGSPPRGFESGNDMPAIAVPPAVPTGLPSALLDRRPDIRQAEQQLVAANANIGVARAQFFPSISLTGLLGRVSPTLHALVGSGGRGIGTLDGLAGLPIFTGGALTANYEIARARAEQAALIYRRTVLTALQEVSDALIAYDRNRAEAQENQRLVAVTSESLRLAMLRFRSGVISYLEVLDAQRQLFSAQLNLNTAELNQRLAAVQLYRALGGGWSQ